MAEFIADGTVVKLSQADTSTAYGSATFDTLGQINGFSLPSGERPLIDVTDLADTIRQYKQGIMEMGDLTLDVHYDPASTSAPEKARTAMVAGEDRWLEITFDDGSTIRYWSVLVTTVGSIEGSEGDKLTCQITFKATSNIQTPA